MARFVRPFDAVGLTKFILFLELQVKLFDFGLAKELDPLQRTPDGQFYEMSGGTGSRRFMAPEVALGGKT